MERNNKTGEKGRTCQTHACNRLMRALQHCIVVLAALFPRFSPLFPAAISRHNPPVEGNIDLQRYNSCPVKVKELSSANNCVNLHPL